MKKVKKVFLVLFLLLFSCSFVWACNDKPIVEKKAELTVSPTSVSIVEGQSANIVATLKNSTEKVEWSSSNNATAIVDKDGKVTAIKVGTATITATAAKISATCAVTVTAAPIVTVAIDKSEAQLDVGKTLTIIATPTNSSDTITWESSDTNVASVSGGVVTALKDGVSAITASVAGVKSAACSVRVTDRTGYIAINTPEMLDYIAQNMSGKYYLTNDIDYNGESFNCLGWKPAAGFTPFSGILDGNGHAISNIKLGFGIGYADGAGEIYNNGIFREIDENGIIRNLNITDCTMNAGSNFGIFADSNYGTIENVFVSATLNMTLSWGTTMGGFVSSNNGVIRNSIMDISGSVVAPSDSTIRKIGAIAGVNAGDIYNCYAYNRNSIKSYDTIVGEDVSTEPDLSTCHMVDGLDLANVSSWGMWSVDTEKNPIITAIANPDASVGLDIYSAHVEDGFVSSALSVFAFVYPFDSVAAYSTDSEIITVESVEGKMKITPSDTSITAPTTVNATATITVGDKNYSSTCVVTVDPAKYEVTLAEASQQIVATIDVPTSPIVAEASLKGVKDATATFTYKSNNEDIATVDATGKVTAKKAGIAEIEVTAVGSGDNANRVCRQTATSSIIINGTIYDSDFKNDAKDTDPTGWNMKHKNPSYNQATLKVREVDSQKVLKFDSDRAYNYQLLSYGSNSLGAAPSYYTDYTFTGYASYLAGANTILEFMFASKTGDLEDAYSFKYNETTFKISYGKTRNGVSDGANEIGVYKKLDPASLYTVRVAVTEGKAYFYIKENNAIFSLIGAPITLDAGYNKAELAFGVSSAKVQFNTVSLNYGIADISLEIAETEKTLDIGFNHTINAFFPFLSDTVKIVWSSSDATTVTVSDKGVINAIKSTTTPVNITATVEYKGNTYTKTCAVTVRNAYSISATQNNFDIAPNATKDISSFIQVKFGAEIVTDQTVSYESANPLIATIDDKGVVTAIKSGTTTIIAKTATSVNTATLNINVTGNVLNETFATLKEANLPASWQFKNRNWAGYGTTDANGTEGKGIYFNNHAYFRTHVLYLPDVIDGATNYYTDITYTKFDTIKNGEAQDTTRYIAVHFAYKNKARNLTDAGNIARIGFGVTQGAKTGSEKTFMVSDDGAKEAKSTYTAYSEDISAEKTYTIRVMVVANKAYLYLDNGNGFEYISSDTFDTSTFAHAGIGIELSSSHALIQSAKVGIGLPEDINAKMEETTKEVVIGLPTKINSTFSVGEFDSVVYKSSNTAVATVDNTGIVTALTAGATSITAEYTFNGAKYTSPACAVTTIAKNYLVNNSKSNIELLYNSAQQLNVKVMNNNVELATQPTLTWTSGNAEIVTVEGGLIKGIKTGATKITCSQAESANTITINVTVINTLTDFTQLTAGKLDLPGWGVANSANNPGVPDVLTVDAKGLIVDTVAHGSNRFVYGTSYGELDNYYIDYTFSDWACYKTDATRFIAFHFAYGKTDMDKNHFQVGFRANGQSTFFTKYEKGIAKQDVKFGYMPAFTTEKAYTIRAEIIKKDETTKTAKFYIAEVTNGVVGAFTPIKIDKEKTSADFDSKKFPVCGIGMEANSSSLRVQKIQVHEGTIPQA